MSESKGIVRLGCNRILGNLIVKGMLNWVDVNKCLMGWVMCMYGMVYVYDKCMKV